MPKRTPQARADVHARTADYERWLHQCVDVVAPELALKHERMQSRAFVFFRATFYRWADYLLEAPELFKSFRRVDGMGDAHIENFGTWRDEEGRLAWGANDLDEACKAPWLSDVLRLAVSARLAIDEGSLHLKAGEAAGAILAGYTESLKGAGRPHVLAEHSAWLREIAINKMRNPEAAWRKLEASMSDAGPGPSAKLRKQMRASLPARATDVKFHARVAGAGSLGRPRWVARGLLDGSYCAREAKAWMPSALSWAEGKPYKNCRVQAQLLAHSAGARDPVMHTSAGWTIKRIGPEHGRIELDEMQDSTQLLQLLGAMGAEVANLHLSDRSKGARVLTEAKNLSADTFRALSRDFEQRVCEDHKAYVAGVAQALAPKHTRTSSKRASTAQF